MDECKENRGRAPPPPPVAAHAIDRAPVDTEDTIRGPPEAFVRPIWFEIESVGPRQDESRRCRFLRTSISPRRLRLLGSSDEANASIQASSGVFESPSVSVGAPPDNRGFLLPSDPSGASR